MKRLAFFLPLCVGAVLAADVKRPSPGETIRSVVAHDDDFVTIHTATRLATLIVLPEQEKAAAVFCGDKDLWSIDVVPGAERYISVKPAKAGSHTDIQIVTDRGHAYTIKAVEGGDDPTDLKVFIRPSDTSSLLKPVTLVSADEAERLKKQAADALKELEANKKAGAEKSKEDSDAFRAAYPGKIKFTYKFEKGKDPFNVQEIWRDDKFTYIKAYPSEQPALYEIRDGKPSLIEYQIKEGGTLYIVPKILENSYLQIGKRKMEVWRDKTGG